MNIIELLAFGALGAIVKDIFKDNYLVIPSFKEGKLYLGCIGGIIIGAIAGYIVDNDPITAFLGGYAGYQIIESLVNQNEKAKIINTHKLKIKTAIVKSKIKKKE